MWGVIPEQGERMTRPGIFAARFRLLAALCVGGILSAFLMSSAMAQSKDAKAIFSQEELCEKSYQTGLEYLKNCQLRDAAEAFTEVKEACPDMIDAYLNLGAIEVQLKEYMRAIDTYQDALDQDADNLDVKEAMAYALSCAGELDDAAVMYLELHEARPQKTDIIRNLAFVYKQKGLIAEAVMLYNRLIELGAADPTMVSEAGRLALEQKLYLPAITFYKKLYEYNQKDVNTLSILGGYYFKIKFYDQAVGYYDKILELEQDSDQTLQYHKIRAACLKSIKEHARAAEDYEYVLAQEPSSVANYCNLIFVYKNLRNFEKAVATVKRGLEVDPNAGCLYYGWGLTLEGQGKSHEKRKRFEDAIDSYKAAKGKFQRVIDLDDPTYARYARKQLERMDLLIERVKKLQEREEMNQ
ncbi:MAG: tetratricopeptide repeat protein [Candidatus Eisenbacteria sp.]|nr:tetratricopeptide repeat protein [Candidatus Eisenbacteria bacterium]